MKKPNTEVAVGDWVLVEGILIGRPSRRPGQVLSITNSMIQVQAKPDRWGDNPPHRKAKKSIVAVFDNFEEADDFCEFLYSEYNRVEAECRSVRDRSQARIVEFAKKYESKP